MNPETRLEHRLDRLIARARSPRSAAIVIAGVTTVLTLAAGLVMTAIERDNFPTLGSGLWWAAQTVSTVGYGDHVPATGWGQAIAAVVMLLGIGFITVITASITGSFVNRSRKEDTEAKDAQDSSAASLRALHERLDRIEAALQERR